MFASSPAGPRRARRSQRHLEDRQAERAQQQHVLASFKHRGSFLSSSSSSSPRPFWVVPCARCLPAQTQEDAAPLADSAVTVQLGLRRWRTTPLEGNGDRRVHADLHPEPFDLGEQVLKVSYLRDVMTDCNAERSEVDSLVRKMNVSWPEWTDKFRCRLLAWLADRLFWHGVIYHPGQLVLLKHLNLSEHPVVFLPAEQSWMDAFLLNEILRENGVNPARPVKRTTVLPGSIDAANAAFNLITSEEESYMDYNVEYAVLLTLLKRKSNLQFYVQRGKTFGGGLCTTMMELLECLLYCVKLGDLDDILLVPTAIAYDLVPEQKESLLQECLSMPATRSAVRIDFAQPFSLKEYMLHASQTALLETNDEDSVCPTLSEHLARHVVGTNFRLLRIMATEILAFVFLYLIPASVTPTATPSRPGKNENERAWTREQLVGQFQKIRDAILARDRDVGFSGKTKDAVDYGLRLLADWLDSDSPARGGAGAGADGGRVYRPRPSARFLLERLSSNVVGVFAAESILVTSLCADTDTNIALQQLAGTRTVLKGVCGETLLQKAQLLAHFLYLQFPICLPCEDGTGAGSTGALDIALDRLTMEDVLRKGGGGGGGSRSRVGGAHLQDRMSRKLARQVDMDCNDDEEEGTGRYGQGQGQIKEGATFTLSLTNESVGQLSILIKLLSWRLKLLYHVILVLEAMVEDQNQSIEVVTKTVGHNFLPHSYEAQDVHFVRELILNYLRLFESMGVLWMNYSEETGEAGGSLGIKPDWMKNPDRLKELRCIIHSFLL